MIYLHLKPFLTTHETSFFLTDVTEIGVFTNHTCLCYRLYIQPLPVIWHANIRLAEISLEAGLWRVCQTAEMIDLNG